MKLEITALVAGAAVGVVLALVMSRAGSGGIATASGATDLGGNVSLGLEDRSLR